MTMTTPTPSGKETPDLKRLLGRLMNKQYAMAADEHKEGASDSSVKRHYDEAVAAENEFTEALDALRARAELAEELRASLEKSVSAAEYVIGLCESNMKAGDSPAPHEKADWIGTSAHCYAAMSFVSDARAALAKHAAAKNGGRG